MPNDETFGIHKNTLNFAPVHLNKLMKKGGGIGPMKPWQPSFQRGVGAKSYSVQSGKDKLKEYITSLFS